MDNITLKKANDLKSRIKEVKQFLEVFKESANIKRGSGSTDIDGWFKIETKKRISILGTRWFGLGSHKAEIDIPFDMVEMLEMVFKDKLTYLEESFKDLGREEKIKEKASTP